MLATQRKINRAFGFALGCLVMIGGFSFHGLRKSADETSWVLHTSEVMNYIESLLVSAEAIESGQRGYLLTSDESFLDPYIAAVDRVDDQVKTLKRLIKDNPTQERRAHLLEELITKKKTISEQTIQLARSGNRNEAIAIVTSGAGNKVMNQIRELVTEMEGEEQLLFKERTSAKDNATGSAGLFILFGTILGCAVVLFSRWFIMRDLKARELSQKRLQESEERFQIVARATQDAVWDWDLTTNTIWWNGGIEKLFGYKANDIRPDANWWVEHLHPEDKERITHGIHQVVDNNQKEHWGDEYRFLKRDGSYASVFDRGFVIRNQDGKAVRILGSMMDVSEQKQLQEQLITAREAAIEASRMKSEFLANMSHEIRTPMNGVIGMTGLLLDTALDPQQKDYAETVRNSADSLLTIINDILDFSKIEAGKLDIEFSDFELRNVIEGCAELLAPEAHKKGVEFVSFIEPSIAPYLIGDSGRIRQMIMNLLGNAIKFTLKGEVLLQVLLQGETKTHALLRFEIKDTGIGISQEHQEKLFKSFTQADGSTARKYGGTGLGLAISKQLATLMDGEMGVTSELGVGSTFWFTLSLEKAKNQSPSVSQSVSGLNGLRCLVVDDNATNQKIVHAQILSWGMRNGSPSSPAMALEILRREAQRGDPYDLAILDMHMPEMSGVELAQVIKSDPLISGTRVILMSSLARPGSPAEIKEAGILACLTKPVRQSHLYNCLVEVMSRSGAATTNVGDVKTIATSPDLSTEVKTAKILVAEDNPINQKIALIQLKKLGYRADAVANGIEALEAMSRIDYDIVLMDCQMPEMDGYQATQELRKREENVSGKHTIVIAMTANALEGDHEKCLAAGMDDHVGKPVKMEVLAQTLERAINLKQSGLKRSA